MAELLLPSFSRVVITTPGTYKVSEPERVCEIFRRSLAKRGAEPNAVVFIKETEKAIRYVFDQGREQELPVLGTGSFYLAAELRAFAAARSGAGREALKGLGQEEAR
jgi:dihydrofolate synthase/folylpolyglutamate synthase